MPIDDLPPRLRELGRLKLGEDLGDRPTQLETWRLTSAHEHLIAAAAVQWGGQPNPTDTGWEVTTESKTLEVLLPPQDVAASQFWEHWTAGGLQRRCTGSSLIEYDDSEPDGFRKVAPCVCDEENGPRVCRPTTVLRVLLPQLPDLGTWRLVSRSLFAATELPASAAIISRSYFPEPAPATLSIEKRSSKKPGSGRRDFVVPILGSTSSLAELYGQKPLPGLKNGSQDHFEETPIAQIAPEAPKRPLTAPEEEFGSQSPDPPENQPYQTLSEANAWDGLARFLTDHPPGSLKLEKAGLLTALEQIDDLSTRTGLWAPESVTAAAQKRGIDDWRTDPLPSSDLKDLADRALLALHAAYDRDDRRRS